MPQRDYAARPQEKKGSFLNKLLLILIVLAILTAFGLALLFLKDDNTPAQQPNTQATAPQQSAPQSKTDLPSKPEETWSYIRDLETREIATDGKQKPQLNDEQKQILEKLAEDKRKQEEQQRLAEQQAQQAATQTATDANTQAQTSETQESVELTPEQLAAQQKAEQEKKLQAQKLAEEKKRKAEQLKKQQQQQQQEQLSLAKKLEDTKKQQEEAKKAELAKAEAAKKEASKKAMEVPQQKVVQTVGRFGLQCGAFKNKAQAENMQARLAMAGYHARINSNADWNRVVVGPIGDRPSAAAAQSNAKSVADCVVVAM